MGQVDSGKPGAKPRHRSQAAKPGTTPGPVQPESEHHHGHAANAVPEVPTDLQYRQGHKAH